MRLALPLLLVLAACQAEAPDPAAELDSVPTEPAAVTMEAETASGAKLNLNTATEDEFKALGIGDRMAHEFDEYRPYASIREFRQEIGKYINDDPDQLAEYERDGVRARRPERERRRDHRPAAGPRTRRPRPS